MYSLSILCTDVALWFCSTCCSALPGWRMHVQKSPGRSQEAFACLARHCKVGHSKLPKGVCVLVLCTRTHTLTLLHSCTHVSARICKSRNVRLCWGYVFVSSTASHCVVTIEFFIEILGLIAALFIFVRYLFLQRNVTWYYYCIDQDLVRRQLMRSATKRAKRGTHFQKYSL